MTPFGKQPDRSARDLVRAAVSDVVAQAGIHPRSIEAAYVGNALDGQMSGQAMIRGQVALRDSGLPGIPIVNVEKLAWQLEGRCGERQIPGARAALAHCGGGWVGTDTAAATLVILTR
jgi:acetyl-CoA acetyltransferase